MSLMITDNTPSFHSLVFGFMQPYSSSFVTAFGSTIAEIVSFFGPSGLSSSSGVIQLVFYRIFQIVDLAAPGFPIKKTECLTSRISAS